MIDTPSMPGALSFFNSRKHSLRKSGVSKCANDVNLQVGFSPTGYYESCLAHSLSHHLFIAFYIAYVTNDVIFPLMALPSIPRKAS